MPVLPINKIKARECLYTMRRFGLLSIILAAALIFGACAVSANALVHLKGKVYYSVRGDEGTLNNMQKDALNGLLSNIEDNILSDRAENLDGEEFARFYNEKRDIVVSINSFEDEYYLYTADILDGNEHSKRYFTIPADTASYLMDIIEAL